VIKVDSSSSAVSVRSL